MPPSERNMNGHYNHNLSHQKQGRNHDREWESTTVNGGRAKSRMPAVPSPVPTITQTVTDGKRDRQDRRNTRQSSTDHHQQQQQSLINNKQILFETKYSKTTNIKSMETNERTLNRTLIPTSKNHTNQTRNKNNLYQTHKRNESIRSNKSFQNSASSTAAGTTSGCYVGSAAVNVCESASVFGVYSETKYTFSVNGLPGNPAQASAAAAFFAR